MQSALADLNSKKQALADAQTTLTNAQNSVTSAQTAVNNAQSAYDSSKTIQAAFTDNTKSIKLTDAQKTLYASNTKTNDNMSSIWDENYGYKSPTDEGILNNSREYAYVSNPAYANEIVSYNSDGTLNLTDEKKQIISTYSASIINDLRQQLGNNKVYVTADSIANAWNIANAYSNNYNADTWKTGHLQSVLQDSVNSGTGFNSEDIGYFSYPESWMSNTSQRILILILYFKMYGVRFFTS